MADHSEKVERYTCAATGKDKLRFPFADMRVGDSFEVCIPDGWTRLGFMSSMNHVLRARAANTGERHGTSLRGLGVTVRRWQ